MSTLSTVLICFVIFLTFFLAGFATGRNTGRVKQLNKVSPFYCPRTTLDQHGKTVAKMFTGEDKKGNLH